MTREKNARIGRKDTNKRNKQSLARLSYSFFGNFSSQMAWLRPILSKDGTVLYTLKNTEHYELTEIWFNLDSYSAIILRL